MALASLFMVVSVIALVTMVLLPATAVLVALLLATDVVELL